MSRDLALVSVSIDLGAGRRGVDMGPSALRIAGITPALQDLDYSVREIGTVNAAGPESVDPGDSRAKFLEEIRGVCQRTHDLVLGAMDQGCFPVILGGDHSLSMGSVAAVADHYRNRDQSIGLIWVDAHTDMNTPETTPSGNIHGMSLAILTGHGPESLTGIGGGRPSVDPERVSVIGAREIDGKERELVKESGIRVFTMDEVDRRGAAACMDEAVERATDGTAGFHISFDLDSIDPMQAPGVGTPVDGGLTYREAHLVAEKAWESGRMVSFEMVELNPVLDERGRTAHLGVEIAASALGKTIL
jgi:arginase